MDAEAPVNYVAQLSGHKNLKSLDSCKTDSYKTSASVVSQISFVLKLDTAVFHS